MDEIEMGVDCMITPISVPAKKAMLPIHLKKGAFLIHVATEMPVAMDGEGIAEFLEPLFRMQKMGSRNNILIAFGDNRMAVADALVVWQLFGGIALPVIGTVEATLKVIDQLLAVPMNGIDWQKRAAQLATGLPYPELDVVDQWGIERALVYAMVNGKLPFTEKDSGQLFDLTVIDRNELLKEF